MGDPQSPYMQPPPLPEPKSNLSHLTVLYYGVFMVGTAAIVLVLYNLIIIKWCTGNSHSRPRRGIIHLETAPNTSFGDPRINSMTSFKYKKHGLAQDKDQGNDYECVVCLSVFEEGEEVRTLLRCKHSFHAPCIDMWLYSHFDCPICRSPVERPVPHQNITGSPSENSRDGLLLAGVV